MDVRSLALSATGSMLVCTVVLTTVPYAAHAADATDQAVATSSHVSPALPGVNPVADKIAAASVRPDAPPLPGEPAGDAAEKALPPLSTKTVATRIVHRPREYDGPPMAEPNATHTLEAPSGTVAVADNGPARSLPGKPAGVVEAAADTEHVMEAPIAEADPAKNAASMRAITKLQRALAAHGYQTGPATGWMDGATKVAVLKYQHDASLDGDAYSLASLEKTVDSVYYANPPIIAADATPPSRDPYDPAAMRQPAKYIMAAAPEAAVVAAPDAILADADDAATPGPTSQGDRAKAATLAQAWANAFSGGAAVAVVATVAAPEAQAVVDAPTTEQVASAADTPVDNAPAGNSKAAALADAMATLYRGQHPAQQATEQMASVPAAAATQTAVQPAIVSTAGSDVASRAIAWVQQRLDAKGFDAGPANGQLGNFTSDAIADFQVANGMKPTGQIDGPLLDLLAKQ